MCTSGTYARVVSRTPRGLSALVVALAVAISLLAVVPSASGTRVPPRPDTSMPTYTQAEAEAVLAKAQRQLRRDTKRVRARRPVGNSTSTEITLTLRDLHLARRALDGTDRREARAVLARPSDAGGDDLGDLGTVAYGANTVSHYCPSGGVACIHYATTGSEALTAQTPANYVPTVYNTVAQVLNYEHGVLGYKEPLADGGSGADADNPSPKIDIYLAELGDRGLYGYCAPDDGFAGRRVPGYCVLDNDYARAEYGAANYLNPLRVTAAHELFHAIQFAYDMGEDSWFMEGTATWVEDEVYDAINDNLQFLAFSPIRYPFAPADLTPEAHRLRRLDLLQVRLGETRAQHRAPVLGARRRRHLHEVLVAGDPDRRAEAGPRGCRSSPSSPRGTRASLTATPRPRATPRRDGSARPPWASGASRRAGCRSTCPT